MWAIWMLSDRASQLAWNHEAIAAVSTMSALGRFCSVMASPYPSWANTGSRRPMLLNGDQRNAALTALQGAKRCCGRVNLIIMAALWEGAQLVDKSLIPIALN
jgi:hypothetical protein